MNKALNKIITILGVLTLLLLWWMCTNVFAMSLTDVKVYIHKKVLVTYKEYGNIKADMGTICTLILDDQDNTFDKIYSYIVLYSKRGGLVVLKINDIKSIEEITND